MRRKILTLLSVLIILGISSSMVYAGTGNFFDEVRTRGVDSNYVAFKDAVGYGYVSPPTKDSSGGYYYVTLTRTSYRLPGVPLTITTTVGQNDLVFRPYTDASSPATNNTINFRNATPNAAGEYRKSAAYGSPSYSEAGHHYSLKSSLNSTSAASSFGFSGRFTP